MFTNLLLKLINKFCGKYLVSALPLIMNKYNLSKENYFSGDTQIIHFFNVYKYFISTKYHVVMKSHKAQGKYMLIPMGLVMERLSLSKNKKSWCDFIIIIYFLKTLPDDKTSMGK